jgi:hypothetical protein
MTAVEWLFNQLSLNNLLLNQGIKVHKEIEQKILEQAKEMEHEQMEITWNNAIDAQLKDKWDSYDDFHKTTFKSE